MTARTFLARLGGLALGALVLVAVYQLKVQAGRCAKIEPPECVERVTP